MHERDQVIKMLIESIVKLIFEEKATSEHRIYDH